MTGEPAIHGFFDEPTNTVSYIVADPATKEAAFIDPVLDHDPGASEIDTRSVEAMLRFAEDKGYRVAWTPETHAHADHLSGSPYVKANTGIGEHIKDVQRIFRPVFDATDLKTDGSDFDHLLKDGERFKIGELDAEVLYRPYRVGDAALSATLCSCPTMVPRADFPGGDAHQLYRSIRRLMSLPDETRLLMCHDYKTPGRDVYAWETTVKEQREKNVHVKEGVAEDAFVRMREARDTRLLLPSIQVNIRAGKFPRQCQRRELSHHSGEVQECRSSVDGGTPCRCNLTTRANLTPRQPKPPGF